METIFNQLVYFGFLQCLFLLVIYGFSAKTRDRLNGYIVFLVLVLLIGLSGRVVYISGLVERDFRLIAFSEFATLLFGATVYLFTRSSLQVRRFQPADLIHYLPGLCYSLFVIVYFMLPSDAIIGARIRSGELEVVIFLLMGTGLIVNIGYWLLSLRCYLRMRKQLQAELSYTVKTRFFLNFLLAIAGCLLLWLLIYLISLFGPKMLERDLRQFIWLSIAFIILFIACYSYIAPDVLKLESLERIGKYTQSKLKSQDLEQLKTDLDRVMQEKKPYLNKKLMKAELAELLGVSNPDLARLLNENIGMNFFEYVNYYRIKEFVALAQAGEGKHLTLFGLAQEAGFNSKTTFNKAFKALMGTSPSAYLNKQAFKAGGQD